MLKAPIQYEFRALIFLCYLCIIFYFGFQYLIVQIGEWMWQCWANNIFYVIVTYSSFITPIKTCNFYWTKVTLHTPDHRDAKAKRFLLTFKPQSQIFFSSLAQYMKSSVLSWSASLILKYAKYTSFTKAMMPLLYDYKVCSPHTGWSKSNSKL